jgi:hypothetical protein
VKTFKLSYDRHFEEKLIDALASTRVAMHLAGT